MLRITLATFFLVCASFAQAATVMLDQSNSIDSAPSGPLLFDEQNFAQTFTAGIAGNLVQVDLALVSSAAATTGFTLSIYGASASGPETGVAPLFSQFYDVSYVPVYPIDIFTSFDVSSAGIVVGLGDTLSIVVSRTTTIYDALVNQDQVSWSNGDSYSSGVKYESVTSPTGPWNEWEGDMAFQTHVSAVPVPAAVWLFGSALAGLGWMRRRNAVSF
jgi:hypothetical protein